MTPPFSIGQEVKIVGPSKGNSLLHMGQTFEISQSKDGFYSKRDMPWYPASSLRLVEKVGPCPHATLHSDIRKVLCHAPVEEAMLKPPCSLLLEHGKCHLLDDLDEELNIGDWVEVIGSSVTGGDDDIGKRFVIEEIDDPSWPYHQKGYSHHGLMWSIWPASSLRKLAPEEIAMHTSTIGYKMQELQDATEKGMAAIRKLLAPIVEKHVADALKRLSDIESRMDSIGPSHSELMGDVEALAEKVGAIEKRQDRQTEASDILSQRLAAQKTRMDKQQKAIDCLEAYQRGEMSEVIPDRKPNINFVITASYDPDYVKKALDSMWEA
jgi:uncharacterized coiled-coil protein SlyX